MDRFNPLTRRDGTIRRKCVLTKYVGLALMVAAARVSSAANCESLVAFPLKDGTITEATSITPPTTIDAILGYRQATITVPFCRVSAELTPTRDSVIKMEVWLPSPEKWNGKFEGVGNGGLGGAIVFNAMVPGLMQGYATAATDTGHDNTGGSGAFALGHREKIIDYGYRSTHLTALAAKAIITSFYGRQPAHAYFSGCSQGGQEAMMEAQRFPQDYDGIIAGAPDYNQTHHEIGAHLWISLVLFGSQGGALSVDKAALVGRAVNDACDTLDGVKDGVLEDPRQCRYDPGELQCKGTETAACLTAPQVQAVRKIWAGPQSVLGAGYYPGFERGGEADTWKAFIAADTPDKNLHAYLGMPFFKYFVFDDPAWNYDRFDFKTDPALVERRVGRLLNATDPDLRPFERRGGKLLHYHGYGDPGIPPRSSIDYYEKAAKTLGGRAAVDPFYRLFMVPGMGHCGGGPGANAFDMLSALEHWVEDGVAPARIVATKYADNDPEHGTLRTHPLCPYPQVARYRGAGSPDDAANFDCAAEAP